MARRSERSRFFARIVDIGDHDDRAIGRKARCNGMADAALRAGDDGYLVL